jgi:hypothetical protein
MNSALSYSKRVHAAASEFSDELFKLLRIFQNATVNFTCTH